MLGSVVLWFASLMETFEFFKQPCRADRGGGGLTQ